MENVKGFKIFKPDWTCRGFQYEVGKTYEQEAKPYICDTGFHFCKKAIDCFNYYTFNPENKIAEVVALGEISEEGDKCATNKIQIIREISWHELLSIVNTGKGNSGYSNTGNWNVGNSNTGDCNTGDWNTGDRNTGDRNVGNWNVGNNNTGKGNTGDWNTGDGNTGDRNVGNRNTGDSNMGEWNTGDWNKSSFNSGCFNTEQHKLKFFDKETDMTMQEWWESEARYLLCQIDLRPATWCYAEEMTDKEKEEYPEYKTTGGYLKVCDNTNSYNTWWNGLTEKNKNIIKSIPNFDAYKFYEITGIRVERT